ncbi:hypothetical protein TNCV_2283711 [Trichonephila clavipes]|nr:hypothetical protein TNCV_2283711 [Trichonephila clavipes]
MASCTNLALEAMFKQKAPNYGYTGSKRRWEENVHVWGTDERGFSIAHLRPSTTRGRPPLPWIMDGHKVGSSIRNIDKILSNLQKIPPPFPFRINEPNDRKRISEPQSFYGIPRQRGGWGCVLPAKTDSNRTGYTGKLVQGTVLCLL